LEADRKEAEEAGLFFTADKGQPERYTFNGSEITALRAVLNRAGAFRGNAVGAAQTMWRETYAYDANGNRVAKTTPWGTIAYSYDAENRLARKGDIAYTYDRDGNLLSEKGLRREAESRYNGANRMTWSSVTDHAGRTRTASSYGYDAFGRRTVSRDEGGDSVRTLYDGFTFETLREGAAFRDGTLTARYSSGAPSANGTAEEGTRYRWLSGEEVGGVRTQRIEGDAYTAVTARYAGTGATLYGNGEAVAVSRSAGANTRGGTAYLGKDVLGSVRSSTGETGQLEDRYEYDAFGKPYKGDFNNGVNLGYTGKPYDAVTGLYNYGYRDYQPETARFTTVDPVRDGSNWFAYVNNDPVNYVDLWGLKANDKNANTSTAYMVPLAGFGATMVAGGNVTLSYVYDTAGNRGMAISGDVGVGLSANIDSPLSFAANALLGGVSKASHITSTSGTIQNFAGPYAVTEVHVGLGLTQDINNPKDTKVTFDTAIGGGSYMGYTSVIEFYDGDGKK
jgi:RHS repeat-associated protein